MLNKTGIDDDIAEILTGCVELRELEVAETRITSEGLNPIIRACPHLWKLNLTGCRGIKVADRRRFFEVSINKVKSLPDTNLLFPLE